jgi:hypothetical protein
VLCHVSEDEDLLPFFFSKLSVALRIAVSKITAFWVAANKTRGFLRTPLNFVKYFEICHAYLEWIISYGELKLLIYAVWWGAVAPHAAIGAAYERQR